MTNLRRTITAAVILLCMAIQAYALSDKDYDSLMTDLMFAEADKNLNGAWDEAKSSLTPSQFNALKKEQTQWIKKGRDNEAANLMKQGLSQLEAYSQVTNERADYIRKFIDSSTKAPTTH